MEANNNSDNAVTDGEQWSDDTERSNESGMTSPQHAGYVPLGQFYEDDEDGDVQGEAVAERQGEGLDEQQQRRRQRQGAPETAGGIAEAWRESVSHESSSESEGESPRADVRVDRRFSCGDQMRRNYVIASSSCTCIPHLESWNALSTPIIQLLVLVLQSPHLLGVSLRSLPLSSPATFDMDTRGIIFLRRSDVRQLCSSRVIQYFLLPTRRAFNLSLILGHDVSAQVASALLLAMEADYRACLQSEVKYVDGTDSHVFALDLASSAHNWFAFLRPEQGCFTWPAALDSACPDLSHPILS